MEKEMTEDKDLARAENLIYEKWAPYKLGELVAQHMQSDVVDFLREERRRLLNDPRIKAMVHLLNYDGYHACFGQSKEHAKVFKCSSCRVREDFESLLKENEEGK